MSLNGITIKVNSNEIDKKYKIAHNVRRISSASIGAAWLGVGYLGAKSITKNKNSALKEAIAGASDFVLKHLNNGIKHIDKKQKLTKVTELLEKAKNAPAKTKALAVFGAFIANGLLGVIKASSYLKGALVQANNDEKIIHGQRNKFSRSQEEHVKYLNSMTGD